MIEGDRWRSRRLGALGGIAGAVHLHRPGNGMSLFTPAMETALKQPFATVFGAMKIELPGHTLCLLDGGTVTFGGDTYSSRTISSASLASVDRVQGRRRRRCASTQHHAPAVDSDADAATLSSPTYQGSPVTLYLRRDRSAHHPARSSRTRSRCSSANSTSQRLPSTRAAASLIIRRQRVRAAVQRRRGYPALGFAPQVDLARRDGPGECHRASRTIYWGVDKPSSGHRHRQRRRRRPFGGGGFDFNLNHTHDTPVMERRVDAAQKTWTGSRTSRGSGGKFDCWQMGAFHCRAIGKPLKVAPKIGPITLLVRAGSDIPGFVRSSPGHHPDAERMTMSAGRSAGRAGSFEERIAARWRVRRQPATSDRQLASRRRRYRRVTVCLGERAGGTSGLCTRMRSARSACCSR
jgi:hypothetical protein